MCEIVIVSAVKIRKQYMQTDSASTRLCPPTPCWGLAPGPSAGDKELEPPPPHTNVRPLFTDRGVRGFFPPALSSPVMTNCPKWAWSRSRDVLIFWQKSVNPFNASCSKLLLFEGFSAILV